MLYWKPIRTSIFNIDHVSWVFPRGNWDQSYSTYFKTRVNVALPEVYFFFLKRSKISMIRLIAHYQNGGEERGETK